MKVPRSLVLEKRQEQGAATLLMATVLVLAVSMIAVYAARSTVTDQRVAANSLWSSQTSDAATFAMDNIKSISAVDLQKLANGQTSLTFTNDKSNTASDAQHDHAAITNPTPLIYTAKLSTSDSYETVDIEVNVKAANGVAEQKLFERVRFAPFIIKRPDGTTGIPLNNIVAKGDCDVEREHMGSSESTKAAHQMPAHAQKTPLKASMLCKTFKGAKMSGSPSVKEVHSSVGTPPDNDDFVQQSPTAFAGNYFSDSVAHIKETVEYVLNCKSGCKNSHVSGMTGFIWIDGDLVLDGGILGSFGSKAASAVDAGVDSKPVLLYVDGNLTLKNSAVVNGLIYKRGDWDNGTNVGKVYGAVIVNSNGQDNGSLKGSQLYIDYYYYILDNVLDIGRYVRLPGTWRDF